MKPASFAYHRATSVEEVVALLAELGEDARIVAGGQSLVPLMAFRLARPSALVDVNRISELAYVRRDGPALAIGALTRHRAVEVLREPALVEGFDILPRAARLIGHLPIRIRGTFGGSIAHADPTAEWCLLARLLDAEIVATGPGGARTIPAAEFFRGLFTTALGPDEVLVEVRFPAPSPGAAIHEFARRRGDFAIAAAAAAVEVDGGRCRGVRVALGGVGDVPVRVPEAEAMLAGTEPSPEAFAEAGRVAARSVDPPSDIHASREYRRELAAVLVRRALSEAVDRAG